MCCFWGSPTPVQKTGPKIAHEMNSAFLSSASESTLFFSKLRSRCSAVSEQNWKSWINLQSFMSAFWCDTAQHLSICRNPRCFKLTLAANIPSLKWQTTPSYACLEKKPRNLANLLFCNRTTKIIVFLGFQPKDLRIEVNERFWRPETYASTEK